RRLSDAERLVRRVFHRHDKVDSTSLVTRLQRHALGAIVARRIRKEDAVRRWRDDGSIARLHCHGIAADRRRNDDCCSGQPTDTILTTIVGLERAKRHPALITVRDALDDHAGAEYRIAAFITYPSGDRRGGLERDLDRRTSRHLHRVACITALIRDDDEAARRCGQREAALTVREDDWRADDVRS